MGAILILVMNGSKTYHISLSLLCF